MLAVLPREGAKMNEFIGLRERTHVKGFKAIQPYNVR